MLPDAIPRPTRKPEQSIVWQGIAFRLPSLRAELQRILEERRTVLAVERTHSYSSPFADWDSAEIVVLGGFSYQKEVDGGIHSESFVLNPIDEVKLLEILMSNILVRFYDRINCLPSFRLFLRIFS